MGTGFKAPGATRRDAPASRTSPAFASNQRTRPHGGRGTRPHGLPAERMEVATHHKPKDMSTVIEHVINHTAVKMTTSTEFFLTEANRHTPDDHVDSLETSAELGIERVRAEQLLDTRAHANAPNARHLKSNKGGGTAPRDAAAFSNPTVDSPTFSFRWDGAIQFIEPAGAFPQRSSYQPTGGTTTEHSLVCASNRSRYRKRRARTLLYPHNPSDTPPVSVAVTLRLF